MIEAGHKKFEFLILQIKTTNYIDKMFCKLNICLILSGLGNMKGLDIRRRAGNGWWEARGVEAGSTAPGRLRRVRYSLGAPGASEHPKVKG